MLSRAVFSIILGITSNSILTAPLHAKSPSPLAGDALGTLIANTIGTCGHDCWVQLNAPTGHGQAYQIVVDYGRTAANFNGASNDPFTDGSNIAGTSCFDPGGDSGLFSYTTPGIRPSDGKLIAVGSGGHCASGISAAFTFDVLAAAANLNSGGAGGVWAMTVKPARLLKCSDTEPAWQSQGGCDTHQGWWFTSNPDDDRMPIPCHQYYTNHWIDTHDSVWSGIFCTGQGGGPVPGGFGYYDDTASQVHFPTLVSAATVYGYFSQPAHTRTGPSAINDRDPSCPLYIWDEGTFEKWCNITTSPILTSIGRTGLDVAASFEPAVFVHDPGNPTTRRWFLNYPFGGPASLRLWKDTGVSPNTVFTYSRVTLLNSAPTKPNDYTQAELSTGMGYDSADNVLIMWAGARIIYKIADATTGQLSANTATWKWSVYKNGANGVAPPFAYNSGAPANIQSLEPNYPAFVAYDMDNSTGKSGIYLYVK